MDRYRRWGGWIWLGLGLVLLPVAGLLGWPMPGVITWALTAVLLALAVVIAARPGGGAARVSAKLTALLLAVDLAAAVADRFGIFGGPGEPGVSWGNWTQFTDYTAVLLHHPSPVLVQTAAVGATAAEVVLAVLLASGRRRRLVGKATAGLFFVYTAALVLGPEHATVVRYGMPFLIGAALVLSATPAAGSVRQTEGGNDKTRSRHVRHDDGRSGEAAGQGRARATPEG
ncbi:hypothetical protein [Flexivirga meconopsidis]|uniref:hypothetical protein n=1 Tax=Flexivirga meconopsidis TaxID=2977121 RepID=UPI00223F13B3|nr:hypothetical protein [Flexivirga meconopsidis]